MKLVFTFLVIIIYFQTKAQLDVDLLFEDRNYLTDVEKTKEIEESIFFRSNKVDFIQISSTVSDSVDIAIVVYKPKKPSRIILLSHGWHQSVKPPTYEPENPYPEFLTIQVDMRGRRYSTGRPDCNGYELYDFYDAYKYALKNYSEYISDTNQVYFSGGSGGGGNGYAILGKFPDLFCSAVISCGMSDYGTWFKQDETGEFRDDMLPWIGFSPDENPEAYQSRSGITTVKNLLTPVYIVHGEKDIRVPVTHARKFVMKARELNKEVYYLELKNVGTRNHWGNISEEQIKTKDEFRLNGMQYRTSPELPKKGTLVVAGYIVTKHFSVFLNSIDSVGEIEYNLKKKQIKFVKGKGTSNWN